MSQAQTRSQSLQYIIKYPTLLDLIIKFLGEVSDMAAASQLSTDFKDFRKRGLMVLKENFFSGLASFLPIKDTTAANFKKQAAVLFCRFLSAFDYCFSGDAVLASIIGMKWDRPMWKCTSIDVYIAVRPDLFFVQFQKWAQSCKQYFKSGSLFEVGKMDRNVQWYPLKTEDYLRQDIGRWKNGSGQQIRFFFIRNVSITPTTFAMTCCDFTFLANWIIIGGNSAYSHNVGHMRHVAQKKGLYTRHFQLGWVEDRSVWRMFKNTEIAESKAKHGARQQKIRRDEYDARGFKVVGKKPREQLDEKDWDHGL